MSDSYDDMPEIELDDIVSPASGSEPTPSIDVDAIDLDLEFEPTAQPSPTPAPAKADEDAIDLDLDLDLDMGSDTGAAADLDLDMASDAGTSSELDLDIGLDTDTGGDLDLDVNLDLEPSTKDAGPESAVLAEPDDDDEQRADLDALLADIDGRLEVKSPPTSTKSMSGMSQVPGQPGELPDLGGDALSALSADLETKPEEASASAAPRGTVELNVADFDLEDVVEVQGGEAKMGFGAGDLDHAEFDADIDLDSFDVPDTQQQPVPVAMDDDGEEETITADQRPALILNDVSGELTFEAEHSPIVEGAAEPDAAPLLVSPEDDPQAPPLPLSADEPPGRPKVPLDRLQPDPKTVETLKRLAGPSGDPAAAANALKLAFMGGPYDKRQIPEAKDVAIGLGRYLVENGHDADALVEAILTVLEE